MESNISMNELAVKLAHIEELLTKISLVFENIQSEHRQEIEEGLTCLKGAYQTLVKCISK